jgi:hypothetical protein
MELYKIKKKADVYCYWVGTRRRRECISQSVQVAAIEEKKNARSFGIDS